MITVTDFHLHNLGWCSEIPTHYTMFSNFNGIENGRFHCLCMQEILGDSALKFYENMKSNWPNKQKCY